VDRRNKVILAVVVLAAGIALAFQFRKLEFAKPHSSLGEAWHGAVQPATDNPAPQQGQRASAATAFDGRIEAAPGDARGESNSDQAHAPNGTAGATADFARQAAPSSITPVGPLVDLNTPEQTHTIVDGDTLPGIAQHYLGRADRYPELFEYNRDILRNPEVLSIGAELRIPKVALPTQSVQENVSASPAAPETPLTPLMPLPPMQPPATAKAIQPVSSQPAKPHTYKVQPGDNLVDLARKFYGDGRRYESLYEANRSVMHSPVDLRPGMVLTVP
jgi:nucleoid-associated protein YgaU